MKLCENILMIKIFLDEGKHMNERCKFLISFFCFTSTFVCAEKAVIMRNYHVMLGCRFSFRKKKALERVGARERDEIFRVPRQIITAGCGEKCNFPLLPETFKIKPERWKNTSLDIVVII